MTLLSLTLLIIVLTGCSSDAPEYQFGNKTKYSSTGKGGGDLSTDGGNTGSGDAEGETGSESDPNTGSSETEKDPIINNPGMDPVIDTKPETAKIRASNGSGGGTGLLELAFKDSTGLESSYKINAPMDVSNKVYGLHIHLHGDGGGGYKDFPNKEARYDLIGVSVKAPNKGMTWGRAAGRQHALYLNELIQNELVKKYNIDLDKIVFSTVSGGSYFITGNFIPEYGQNYNSKAFVMCGGETPRVAFKDPTTLAKFKIHWEWTSEERSDIVPSIEKSIAAYKKAALAASVSEADLTKLQSKDASLPGEHCEFDNKAYTSGIQQAIDVKFKAFMGQ